MAMFNRIDGMIWFADGLRVLASRAGLRFDTLAHQIGTLDQPDQIAATIRQVVDSLPLPATLPPAEIEGFRRLDTVAEIREIAKNWRNCLAGYLFSVNDGTSAIYLSEQLEAVCSLGRHGRMGWFLNQAKGPKNVDIDPDQLAEIHAAFADAGIPEAAIFDPIKSIIQTDKNLLARLECPLCANRVERPPCNAPRQHAPERCANARRYSRSGLGRTIRRKSPIL
jgi:hypothetical protein